MHSAHDLRPHTRILGRPVSVPKPLRSAAREDADVRACRQDKMTTASRKSKRPDLAQRSAHQPLRPVAKACDIGAFVTAPAQNSDSPACRASGLKRPAPEPVHRKPFASGRADALHALGLAINPGRTRRRLRVIPRDPLPVFQIEETPPIMRDNQQRRFRARKPDLGQPADRCKKHTAPQGALQDR